jgi:hypothetical protein
MHEDLDFNITVFLGCVVGAVVGYHLGSVQQAVDGAFAGLIASAACATVIAELAYAVWSVSVLGSRVLERLTPLITLGVLVALAKRFYM